MHLFFLATFTETLSGPVSYGGFLTPWLPAHKVVEYSFPRSEVGVLRYQAVLQPG